MTEIQAHVLVKLGTVQVQNLPAVGPYTWISFDKSVTFARKGKPDRTFRVVVYGAYNACGLIGSEENGIAILDEDRMMVLLDEAVPASSGYYGPSDAQITTAKALTTCTWKSFRAFVNADHRARYTLS